MKKVYLYNTQTKQKELFSPLVGNKVKLYVCGVTPYDHAHLGHGRCYVTFDVLQRILTLAGYAVTYVRNVTDIDDKLLNKAAATTENDYRLLARKYETSFHDDMHALNCEPPAHEPRVTEHMDQIITFIAGLIEKGAAYVVDQDVYFSIDKFPTYGVLSGRKLEDMQMGARVQVSEKKRNPADFILWKGNNEGQFWQAPWGHGRPGWHIECSALAKTYLGDTIDIHGGGMDLIFPHHENERAQSQALSDVTFSRVWMHNAFVTMNCEKMSKSLGNCCTLRELLEEYDPMVLRYYYLSHHYRTPIDFSGEGLPAAQKAYKRLVSVLGDMSLASLDLVNESMDDARIKEFVGALLDDLNTPRAFGVLFEHLNEIANRPRVGAVLKAIMQIGLGLTLAPLVEEQVVITPEIQALIDERVAARASKDWARSDEIRDQLRQMGVSVEDQATK